MKRRAKRVKTYVKSRWTDRYELASPMISYQSRWPDVGGLAGVGVVVLGAKPTVRFHPSSGSSPIPMLFCEVIVIYWRAGAWAEMRIP